MRRCLILLALLLPAACENAGSRPDFLARVQQDCQSGSTEACVLLQTIQASSDPEPVSAPRRQQRIRSQAQRNTDAIMLGVERARAAPRPVQAPAPDNGPV